MIPHRMQDARQWLVWRSISDGTSAKPRKVPFYVDGTPRRGALDSPEDQSRFGTYAQAATAVQSGAYVGLGFALCNGWQGVDLDGWTERPELNDHVFALCAMTYCELSPSGNGAHAIGYGASFPAIGSGSDGFEAYSAGRFFTVTGQGMSEAPISDLSGYINLCIRPLRPTASVSRVAVPRPERNDYDLNEIRSALSHIPSDDRDTWQAVGQALCGLGDDGFELWDAWSATSEKHDPIRDRRTWESFTGNRTGPEAVFARAQALGWENPRARKPLDISAIGFGKTSLASHRAPCARTIDGSRIIMAHEADKIFKGCVYVRSLNRVLVPGGDLLDATTFNRMYQKYSFMVDAGNTVKAKTPIDALLGNQVMDFDIVHDICFRPELPPATIISEAGRTLVNIWWPVETLRTPGDVTPFLDHMQRLLPVKSDRDQVMAYLAAVIQYPGNKFQWCPVLQGVEGNGKSFISECLEYAIGERYTHKPNASDIANKFTGWLRGKLFICVEEVMTEHKREVLDALKPLITNRRVEIQGKGSDQTTGDNRANFVMFTNYKSAIPASVDKRRYAIYFSGQQSAADIVRDGMGGRYFPNLYTWARSGGLAHIADYLATYPIPDELNPATSCQRAPVTSSLSEAIHESLGGLEQDILECIESGEIGFRDGWISTTMLARKFEKRNVTVRRLVMALTTLGYVKHPGLHDGRCNNPVVMPDGNRPRLYVTADHASLKVDCQGEIARLYAVAQAQMGLYNL